MSKRIKTRQEKIEAKKYKKTRDKLGSKKAYAGPELPKTNKSTIKNKHTKPDYLLEQQRKKMAGCKSSRLSITGNIQDLSPVNWEAFGGVEGILRQRPSGKPTYARVKVKRYKTFSKK